MYSKLYFTSKHCINHFHKFCHVICVYNYFIDFSLGFIFILGLLIVCSVIFLDLYHFKLLFDYVFLMILCVLGFFSFWGSYHSIIKVILLASLYLKFYALHSSFLLILLSVSFLIFFPCSLIYSKTIYCAI